MNSKGSDPVKTKRNSIAIGGHNFSSKKDAASFYRKILNSYSAKESLSEQDFGELIDLYNYSNSKINNSEEVECKAAEDEASDFVEVDDIYVDFHPTYKSTKCFFFVYADEESLFSFLLAINGGLSNDRLLYISCRNSVKKVLHDFKRNIFECRPVKCSISKEEVEWEGCHIDHKSPMTFSVIVKTFQKSSNINVDDIEFKYENSVWRFGDDALESKFIAYHNSLAVLRIISAAENMKLAAKARIKPSKNDYLLNELRPRVNSNSEILTLDL